MQQIQVTFIADHIFMSYSGPQMYLPIPMTFAQRYKNPCSHFLSAFFLVFWKRAAYLRESLSSFVKVCCESLLSFVKACIIPSWKSHSDFPGLCGTVCAQEPLCLPLFPNSVTTSLTPPLSLGLHCYSTIFDLASFAHIEYNTSRVVLNTITSHCVL